MSAYPYAALEFEILTGRLCANFGPCQPLGNGFYYLKGYVKNITAQVMEANRLCIEKERTEHWFPSPSAGDLRELPRVRPVLALLVSPLWFVTQGIDFALGAK